MQTRFDIVFNSLHFAADHPHKRELFKASVANVEIEVSEFCNRACSFCPNAFLDRRKLRGQMTDALYGAIMGDLESIEYAGRICFHRYNEPLADREYILRRIAECSRRLPRAHSKIYTNGDYLTADYIEALREAGLREMMATVYLGDEQKYDPDLMAERFRARLAALGLPYQMMVEEPDYRLARIECGPGLGVFYRGKNFEKPIGDDGKIQSWDRGGSVEGLSTYQRRSPCLVVFNEMHVEMDGTVVPCCNIRTDNPEHRAYKIGRIGEDGSVFDVWCNAAMAEWRRRLLSFGPKEPPCQSCSFAVVKETPAVVAQFENVARQLGLPGGEGRGQKIPT